MPPISISRLSKKRGMPVENVRRAPSSRIDSEDIYAL
jgi:hypothetical protein